MSELSKQASLQQAIAGKHKCEKVKRNPFSTDSIVNELSSLQKLLPELENFSQRYRQQQTLQNVLYSISELSGRTQSLLAFYEGIHELISQLIYAENFFIALKDPQGKLRMAYFKDSEDAFNQEEIGEIEIEGGMTSYLLEQGIPLLMHKHDMERVTRELQVEELGAVPIDWLGVPLLFDDRCAGAIVVQSYDPKYRYQESDKSLLQFVGRHLVQAIERARYRDALESRVAQRTEELTQINEALEHEIQVRKRSEHLQSALFRISELSHNADDISEFYRELHTIIAELTPAQNFYVALVDEETGTLHFPYRKDAFDAQTDPRKGGKGLTEYLIQQQAPLLVNDVQIEQMEQQGLIDRSGARASSWLGVPLKFSGHIFGALVVQSYSNAYSYTKRDADLLTFVSNHVVSAFNRHYARAELEKQVLHRTKDLVASKQKLEQEIHERRRVEDRLLHEATHDALTGLPNRTVFQARLANAIEQANEDSDYEFAILFLDLDRFKLVNDSLGHMMGDKLLQKAAERIRRCLREHDLIARLGGDEFAILLEGSSSDEQTIQLAERISHTFDNPFFVDGERIFTGTSIGIALSSSHYTAPDELLRDADAAMYRAKAQGRRRYVMFDESMHEEALSTLKLENELRLAIERHQFSVHFQPFISLRENQVVGLESLVRWNHPTRGLVMPGEFIALAEEIGLITEIDWYVLNASCHQLMEWKRQYPQLAELSITVNLSHDHFNQSNLPERIATVLEVTGMDPQYLRLEVTEHGLLVDKQHIVDVLKDLKMLGVQLLMDDFGTGYSSLSYLHRFPLDGLKIDRSFVKSMLTQPEHQAIVKTIRALAVTLNLSLIAEGIEDQETLNALRDLDCKMGQGYFISKPQAPDPMLAWLLDKIEAERGTSEM